MRINATEPTTIPAMTPGVHWNPCDPGGTAVVDMLKGAGLEVIPGGTVDEGWMLLCDIGGAVLIEDIEGATVLPARSRKVLEGVDAISVCSVLIDPPEGTLLEGAAELAGNSWEPLKPICPVDGALRLSVSSWLANTLLISVAMTGLEENAMSLVESVDEAPVDGSTEAVLSLDGSTESILSLDGSTNGVKPLDGSTEMVPSLASSTESVLSLDGSTESILSLDGSTTGVVSLASSTESVLSLDGSTESILSLDGSTTGVPPLDGSTDSVPPLTDGEGDRVVGISGLMRVDADNEGSTMALAKLVLLNPGTAVSDTGGASEASRGMVEMLVPKKMLGIMVPDIVGTASSVSDTFNRAEFTIVLDADAAGVKLRESTEVTWGTWLWTFWKLESRRDCEEGEILIRLPEVIRNVENAVAGTELLFVAVINPPGVTAGEKVPAATDVDHWLLIVLPLEGVIPDGVAAAVDVCDIDVW